MYWRDESQRGVIAVVFCAEKVAQIATSLIVRCSGQICPVQVELTGEGDEIVA
jgi:hypothetical protein